MKTSAPAMECSSTPTWGEEQHIGERNPRALFQRGSSLDGMLQFVFLLVVEDVNAVLVAHVPLPVSGFW
jgi:hypothetical protein